LRKPDRIDGGAGRQPTGRPNALKVTTRPAQQRASAGQGFGAVLTLLFLVVLVAKCSSPSTQKPGSPPAAAMSEPAYVAARSLNCRRGPEATAAVAEGLARNDRVVVVERRGDWARLTRVGGDCWVSTSFLVGVPTVDAAGPATARTSGLLATPSQTAVASSAAGSAAGTAVRAPRRHAASRRPHPSHGIRRATGGNFYGLSCPCSGSRICIGPRGGRFCITSGGNKRYGV
jgi:hypothetical protein